MAKLLARTAVINTVRQVKSLPVQLSAPHVILQRDFSLASQKKGIILSQLKQHQLVSTQYVRYLAFGSNRSPQDKDEKVVIEVDEKNPSGTEFKKLTLFQRFKQMYRDYWYVLVPVHLITSAGWFGGFYYMAKSGIDVVAIMESYNISSKITNPLKDSSLGYVAISYAMYKIATPIRYTVTLGGTTVSINYLQKWGYIKPVPSREQLKEMYNNKREIMMDTVKDKREELRIKKEQLKDRTDNLIDDMERKIVTKINDTKKKTTNTIQKGP